MSTQLDPAIEADAIAQECPYCNGEGECETCGDPVNSDKPGCYCAKGYAGRTVACSECGKGGDFV